MKKKTKIIIAMISVLLILGIGIGVKKHMDDKAFKEEMDRVATSDEANRVYKSGLKDIDKNAFTSNGVIKKYKIKEISHNPMGGIDVTLIINGNKNYYIYFTLNKDSNGKLKDGGGGFSGELDDIIKNKEQ